jgi:tripeptide aminopeptidase
VLAAAPEPNLTRAEQLVLELLSLEGTSGQEGAVVEFLRQKLLAAGAPPHALQTDQAHRHSPLGGQTGNLILSLPGTQRGPRRLLTAHMDTVPLCVGAQPRVVGDLVRSADRRTGLGADDRAGVATILAAALEILERGLPHPPLTFGWLIQEEVGLWGARLVSKALLGRPAMGFNWDGGACEKVTIGATGAYRLRIEIQGLASHAGVCPEQGVSAIAIAGLAISELTQGGWHGRVVQGRHEGTSNIGQIGGGRATNVVADQVILHAEARSHDPRFRRRIVRQYERAFAQAARQVRSVTGNRGRVRVEAELAYESFRLPPESACVRIARAAVADVGRQPELAISNGGLDANWLTARGIPTVTLGCGQMNVHTTEEALDRAAFRDACRIALRIATGWSDRSAAAS